MAAFSALMVQDAQLSILSSSIMGELDAALKSASLENSHDGLAGVVSTAVKARIVEALFRLAADPETSFAARSQVTAKLHAIARSQPPDANGYQIKHRIADFERDPEKFKPQQVMKTPPGSPIGDDEIL